ncbi:MAG TPA: hypothetical protein DDZ81_21550 [Acetobacteraceae bacterium]|nr:hypothetical protein [Acetobacteraceae bacterium]
MLHRYNRGARIGILPRIQHGVRPAVPTNNNPLVKRYVATLYPEVAAQIGNLAYAATNVAGAVVAGLVGHHAVSTENLTAGLAGRGLF